MKEGSEAIMSGDQVVTPAIKEVVMSYGVFISTIIDFIIIGFAIFMIIRAYQKTQKKGEAAPVAPPAPSKEEVLLGEIRDILKEKKEDNFRKKKKTVSILERFFYEEKLTAYKMA